MQQEIVLAMLAKEPSHGYELRARFNDALGPLGDEINAGQIYVTLGRLEKAGLVATVAKRPTSDRRSARCTGSRRPARSGSPSGCTRSTGHGPTSPSST